MIDDTKKAVAKQNYIEINCGITSEKLAIFTLILAAQLIATSYDDIKGYEIWPVYTTKRVAGSVVTRKFEHINTIAPMTNAVCHRINVFLPDSHNAKTDDVCLQMVAGIKQNLPSNTTVTVLSIMVACLFVSVIISIYDVIKDPKNPLFKASEPSYSDDLRRCSLAEFAKARHQSRKESSIDISDPVNFQVRSVAGRAPSLCRYESVGSAFTRMRRDSVAPGAATPMTMAGLTTGNDTPCTPPVGPNRAHLKLLGGRPAPLLRRSSFPVSALMDGTDRRGSVDSEDDSSPDVGRRRVRIIRRH